MEKNQTFRSPGTRNGSHSHPDNPSREAELIKQIKELLPKKRDEGCRLLGKFLTHCTDQAFVQNCGFWMEQCCKLNEDHEALLASLEMFSRLIKMSVKFPELVKPISSITPKFVDVFLSKLISYEAAWQTLESIMISYRGSMASFKQPLESMMREKISSVKAVTDYEAQCFALLPSAGGGREKSEAYKENWKTQMNELLQTTHNILAELFRDIRELQSYSDNQSHALSFPNDKPFSELVIHLNSTCTIIQEMLLGQYPTSKTIAVDALLTMVCRGLSVSGASLGSKELARASELREALPVAYTAMVRTLTALVVCCGRALLPVSPLIAKLLGQALLVASEDENLRVVVYSCVSNWLTLTLGGSSIDRIAVTLTAALLADIQYKRPAVLLKEKKKSHEPVREKLLFFTGRETLCLAALKTLDLMINSVGNFLPPDQHKMVQTTVVHIATDMQRMTGIPYPVYGSVPECRGGLYTLMVQLCLEPSPHCPPPTQFALQLLRGGLNDSDPAVVSICSTGMTMLQRIIHPEFSIAAFPGSNSVISTEGQICGAECVKRQTPAQKLSDGTANLENQPVTSTSTNSELPVGKSVDEASTPSFPKKLKSSASHGSKKPSPIQKKATPDLKILSESDENLTDAPDKQATDTSSPSGNLPNITANEGIAENETTDVSKTFTINITHDSAQQSLNSVHDINSPVSEIQACEVLTEKRNVSKSKECVTIDDEPVVIQIDESDDAEPVQCKRKKPNEEFYDLTTTNSEVSLASSDESYKPMKNLGAPPPSATKQYLLRSRTAKSSIDVDIDSKMELRSGTVVSSPVSSPKLISEGRRNVRGRSVSPLNVPSTSSQRKLATSPVSDPDDALKLFDDTVRADYR